MSYCRNCGNKLNPTSKFCSNCGEQVFGDNLGNSQKGSSRKRNRTKIIVWSIISVAILVLVVSLFPESRPNQTNNIVSKTSISSESNTNLIDNLILHFKEDGIIGERKHYKFSVIRDKFADKLVDDCTYESEEGQAFSISLYQFRTNEELKTSLKKSLEENPILWKDCDTYINDCILMDVPDLTLENVSFGNNDAIKKKIVSSFKSFKN